MHNSTAHEPSMVYSTSDALAMGAQRWGEVLVEHDPERINEDALTLR